MRQLRFKSQVKRAMMERGWNIEDLARALGKHPGTVYNVVRVNNPHKRTLFAYAKALGKDVSYFA